MLKKLEALFLAITFAEAGEHEESLSIMNAVRSDEALSTATQAAAR